MGLVLILTTSCGELAFKRGASAKDLQATKKTCQNAGNESGVKKCLEDNGWMVQKLDALGLPDSELFATASVSVDNRMPNQASVESKASTQSEVADKTEDLTLKPRTLKAPAESNKKEVATISTVNAFERYKINSWWKMGGNRDTLELSMTACTEKLDAAHQPDRKTQTFTRAFAACMYEKGWRGLREK